MQASVTEVLKFLHSLKSKGFSCSIINSVRSPLSAFITLEGLEAGKHPLICRYMKGLDNINPSLQLYLGRRYCSEIFKWNTKQSKTRVIWKTSYIISNFICGPRARKMLAVMDLRNICFEKDVVIIRISDLLKTSTQKISSW